jgi:hypothetical protein
MRQAQAIWRQRGPIGKFHNIVIFIRSSPQRREAFKQCLPVGDDQINGDLMVKLDNATRWNSTYDSIRRGLKLKNRIRFFCIEYSDRISEDQLTDDDWNHLSEIFEGLKPFYEATLRVESNAGKGHHGAIWEVLPTLEALLSEMEDGRRRLEQAGRGQTPLAVAYQNAWEKLNKYYNITDDSHSIYAAATLFNPARRQDYFDQQWTTLEMKSWKQRMLYTVKKIWEDNYKGKEPIRQSMPPKRQPDFLDRFFSKHRDKAGSDAFDSYIQGTPVVFINDDEEDLLNWWQVIGDPQLRQQAYDLLSIPAMSAEVERIFSSAKRTISPDRHRLSDETIEQLELLRNWWLRGLATQIRRKR